MSVVFLNLEYASEIVVIAKWLEIEHHLKIMLSHHSNHCNQLNQSLLPFPVVVHAFQRINFYTFFGSDALFLSLNN